MAGPLGQMFDHGCDALNTTVRLIPSHFHPPIKHAYLQLEVLLACRALNLGRSWWPITSQVATLANFYLTTWEEFHTGTLYLGYFSGPVEGIIIIVVLYIITGVYGEFYSLVQAAY